MNAPKCHFGKLKELCNVHKRGSSSYKMHDPKKMLAGFDLKKGETVLDLGCGPGDYTIECARIVGAPGLVYALDRQKELLDDLNVRTGALGLKKNDNKLDPIMVIWIIKKI